MKKLFTALIALLSVISASAYDFKYDGLWYNITSANTVEVTYGTSEYSGDVIIPENVEYRGSIYSVTSIGEEAFSEYEGLTSVTIPNSVTSIGYRAFDNCTGLTSITIPNSVTEIGIDAFFVCRGLKKVEISDLEAWCKINFSDIFSNPLFYGNHLYLNGQEVKDLNIPNSVTSIGKCAFIRCSGLTSITIPNSVTSIGNYAFEYCTDLTSVTIPDSATEIGAYAFSFCQGLKSVTIGNSVTSIGNYAFDNCSGLTSITIPNSVTEIGNGAFNGCSGLTSITIPNSVTEIGNGAFQYCSGLTSITIPNSVTSIGESAFNRCSGLTSITIPNSVTSIGESAFQYCSGLTSITIPNSVTSIGESAFNGCSGLTSITIPNSVTEIGNYAFEGCNNIVTIISLPLAAPAISEDTFPSYTAQLTVPEESVNDYLTAQYWENFASFNGKANLTLDDDVFKYRYLAGSGEAVVIYKSSYSSMTNASIPDRVVVEDEDGAKFYNVAGISSSAFKECKNLTSVKLPVNCKIIGNSAFSDCSSLTSIVIPSSVASIGNSAFQGCIGLTSIVIPSSVASIGNSAFEDCSGLTAIVIPSSVASIGNSAFQGCIGLTSIVIPSSVVSIGNSAFEDCSGLTAMTIEDGLTPLSFESSFGLSSLTDFYCGRNINGAFTLSESKQLVNAEFGYAVTKINNDFFKDCTTLANVTFNSTNIYSIGATAFRGCSSLTEIDLPDDLEEIGDYAFSGTSLENVEVPNAAIGENAFADNNNIKVITLGAGVETIGANAFNGANSLTCVNSTRVTPPAAQNTTFSYYEAPLYIPKEAEDAYYNNPVCWYRFSTVEMVVADGVTVDCPHTIPGNIGDQFQLTATISPANVTLDRVLWSSTNTSVATVNNNGLVTMHADGVKLKARAKEGELVETECEIIASTLYDNGPVASVKLSALTDSSGIDLVVIDGGSNVGSYSTDNSDIFTLEGICLKRNASQEDIDALHPGLYIIGGKKVIVK